MKTLKTKITFVLCSLFLLFAISPSPGQAMDDMSNPNWYITIWDSGYSDWIISPHGHEQLSGEWAAAVLYDGISGGEAMWLEPNWVCPSWVSNSQFEVISPFQAWDDPNNPVVGNDTGQSVISNGQVEITFHATMEEGRTIAGLSPAVADLDSILSHWYLLLQTYTIRNITAENLNNVALFQMMHAQPNDDYGLNNYGVYDPTPYIDSDDGFSGYHYDMTFFGSDVNWSEFRDDIIGFSSAVPPNAWGLGEFPSAGCGGGEPGPMSLHHLVEVDALPFGSVIGPVEVAGAMKWHLGDIGPGQEVQHTILLFTGHSPAGLPPSPGLILLEPELASNEVGSTHTVTATVTLDGAPVEGVTLMFEVVDGPHKSISGEAVTDSTGVATFSYKGIASGTDLVLASGDTDGDGSIEISNLATKEWIGFSVNFLIIDEDSIDNGNPPNFFSDVDVNDHIADIGLRYPLLAFAGNNVGKMITLYTGEVGDEGWFALKEIPPKWDDAGPVFGDGLRNYLGNPSQPQADPPYNVGPGLGTGDDPEALLDKIPKVTPLRATGLKMLEGRRVCAVVYDSDIGLNYDPLNGSLKGDNLGTVAFEVISVTQLTGFSSSSLPKVEIRILDAEEVCEGELELFTNTPEPISSSEPFDVVSPIPPYYSTLLNDPDASQTAAFVGLLSLGLFAGLALVLGSPAELKRHR